MAEPIISDLALRTRFSILNKRRLRGELSDGQERFGQSYAMIDHKLFGSGLLGKKVIWMLNGNC